MFPDFAPSYFRANAAEAKIALHVKVGKQIQELVEVCLSGAKILSIRGLRKTVSLTSMRSETLKKI